MFQYLSGTGQGISTHAPLAGRDKAEPVRDLVDYEISTHAPLAGRDKGMKTKDYLLKKFQPTRPLRGATDNTPG